MAFVKRPGFAAETDKTQSYISTSNSSTATLSASSTYTGTWEDVTGFSDIVVAVKADQDGTLVVEFSPDGTNVDSSLTRYYRTSQIEAPHRFTVTRQYTRVKFTNTSASGQTLFRLQSSIHQGGLTQLNAPADSTLSQDFDAIITRPTDFISEVALGRRQGWSTWNKFGYNDDIDTTTDPEVIASFGGTFQYITSGETLTIVSTSTNDDGSPAGTGAQRIVVYGVDENWDEQIEVVTLDGTTNVVTSTQWIGINRVAIYLAGSLKKNDGTITITATSSGYTLAQMPAGQGVTQQVIFYVPRNHQLLVTWLFFNSVKITSGTDPEVKILGWVYSAVANSEFEVFRDTVDSSVGSGVELRPSEPFVIGEKSILWFTGETDTNDTAVRGRFSGKLVRDVDA